MRLLGVIILGVVATEALTELLIHAEPLDKPRDWLMSKVGFLHKLLSCGWCLSVWVALLVFAILWKGWWIVLMPIAFHRLSNYLHDSAEWLESKKNKEKER